MVNFNQMMKQAQVMQKQMQEVQEQIANKEYIGNAGGGVVTITLNGKGNMQKILINQSLLKEEEKEILEDLIVAAFNDAKQKLEQDSQESMSNLLGGAMPAGFKMPGLF